MAAGIESLGKGDRRAVQSHLKVLLQHLLKCAYQLPPHASWGAGVREARRPIGLILDDSPSLGRQMPRFMAWAYPHASQDASDEIGSPLAAFPNTCPWTPELVLEVDFFPEEPVQ